MVQAQSMFPTRKVPFMLMKAGDEKSTIADRTITNLRAFQLSYSRRERFPDFAESGSESCIIASRKWCMCVSFFLKNTTKIGRCSLYNTKTFLVKSTFENDLRIIWVSACFHHQQTHIQLFLNLSYSCVIAMLVATWTVTILQHFSITFSGKYGCFQRPSFSVVLTVCQLNRSFHCISLINQARLVITRGVV